MNAHRTTKIASLGLTLTLAAFAVAGCSGGGGSKGSLEKFCADYSAIAGSSQVQTLVTDDNNGEASLADPVDNQGFKQAVAGMQQLAKDAPAAIRSEAQLAAKVLKQAASGNPTADTDAGQTAGDHVDSYAQAQCPGAAVAGATPTTQSSYSSSNGADGSSIDNGSDSSSYGDSTSSDSTCDYYSDVDC